MVDRIHDSIQITEEQIPHLAALAVRAAYARARAAGQTVMIAEAGQLIEILPDGSRRVVKSLKPPVRVGPPRIISLP